MDNRELAAAVWLGVLVVGCLVSGRTRSAVLGLVRAALHPKIALPVLLMLALVLLLVWAGAGVGLWVGDLIVPTVAWGVAVGLVLLFNFEHTWKTPRFLSSTASKVLGIGVFITFFTNLFSLSLLGELMLQPTIVFLTLLALVAHREPAHRPVERSAEVLLAAIGAALITFSTVQIIRQWDTLDLRLLALEFALPVWLTAGVLPFIYVMAFYGAYESAFLRVNHAVGNRRGRVRAKLAALLTCRLHVRDADALSFYWAGRAGEAASLSDARQVLREFRRSRREAEQEQEEARLRLVRNAGVQGTDDDGRQLDQREFEETKRALRWLATCQMGWYRNRGGRYRADLLDMLGDFPTTTCRPSTASRCMSHRTARAGGPAGGRSPGGTSRSAQPARRRTSGSMPAKSRPAASPAFIPTGATGPSPSAPARTGSRPARRGRLRALGEAHNCTASSVQ